MELFFLLIEYYAIIVLLWVRYDVLWNTEKQYWPRPSVNLTTSRHDITEILLKVVLNTITLTHDTLAVPYRTLYGEM